MTSDDAHAWVEAYFANIGWLPFDPTPLTGSDAARAVALPWAPHPVAQDPNALNDKPRDAAGDTASSATTANQQKQNGATSSSGGVLTRAIWLGAIVLALIAASSAVAPWLLRAGRRRKRIRRARDAGPEPLWDELADTARDLGIGWSSARTPRQVTVWLGELVPTEVTRASLARLSQAVERARYAGGGERGLAGAAQLVGIRRGSRFGAIGADRGRRAGREMAGTTTARVSVTGPRTQGPVNEAGHLARDATGSAQHRQPVALAGSSASKQSERAQTAASRGQRVRTHSADPLAAGPVRIRRSDGEAGLPSAIESPVAGPGRGGRTCPRPNRWPAATCG